MLREKSSNLLTMKTAITTFLILILGFGPAQMPGQAQFTANMVDVRQGTERNYFVQSDGTRYRYDFEEGGSKGIVIVDPLAERTAILFPEEEKVHFTGLMSSTSLMNDPFQSFRNMQKNYTEKKVGTEKLLGFDAEKLELYADDQKIFTAWYSDKLGFLLKMINHMAENTYMELRNIKERDVDATLYDIPEDYVEVDKRMRPIIPEPPPPESWETIEATIPLKGDFSRGDQLTFKVPESKNYKIILKNQTTEPAKIVRIAMRDGKELSFNEQGPLSYRTHRLFKDESVTKTYSWQSGDDKIIQVHEGKLHIEIVPEE